MGREVELDKLRDSKPSVAAGMEDEEEGDGGEELLLLLQAVEEVAVKSRKEDSETGVGWIKLCGRYPR